MARAMHAAYAGGGAPSNLVMLPPTGDNGHAIFTEFRGRERWLIALDLFLRRHDLPTWSLDLVDRVMQQAGIAAAYRGRVVTYLGWPGLRVLVVDRATGAPYYASADGGLPQARAVAIRSCREHGGTEASCVPVMENFRLLMEHHAQAPAMR
jgi:hypothetical protein